MYFEIKNGIRESNEKKCGVLDFRETESGNICGIRTPSQTLKYLTLRHSPSAIGVSSDVYVSVHYSLKLYTPRTPKK